MDRPKATLLVIVPVLLLGLGVRWQSMIWCLKITILSLFALLALNLIVLYVYLRCFVTPSQSTKESISPLRIVNTTLWTRLQEQRQQVNSKDPPPPCLAESSPPISEAFEELMSLVLRDFIDSWFVHVSHSPTEVSFSKSVDHIIRTAALSLKKRIEDADILAILLNRVVPKVASHISEFRAAEVALRGRSLERSVTQSDELDLLLASQFRGGKLHPALTTAAMTTKPNELAYLRQVVDRLLPHILDPKDLASGPVRVVIREMVTCAVVQPVIDMITDPDFWNQTIDAYLGKAIREQKMVRRLREVLNRHSTEFDVAEDLAESALSDCTTQSAPVNMSGQSPHKAIQEERITPAFLKRGTDETLGLDDDFEPEADDMGHHGFDRTRLGRRSFDEFLKMIEEEKNLFELKRVRNDISTQIAKKRTQIRDRVPEEVIDGEKVEDVNVYVNRLSVAKKRVDKRIAILSGEHPNEKRLSASRLFGSRRPSLLEVPRATGDSLHSVLTSSFGLPYFIEFMDRRGQSVMAQFWLNIEGLRPSPSPGDVQTVYEKYLSKDAPFRLPISDDLRNTMKRELLRDDSGSLQCLYKVQDDIFQRMEKDHFPYFKRSDLYFKYLNSCSNTASETTQERRSLDETSAYRRTDMRAPTPPKSTSLERSTSTRLAKSETWSSQGDRHTKNDWESQSNQSPDTQKHPVTLDSEPSSSFGRTRGHVRAVSESHSTSHGTNVFMSLSKMLGTANHWWNAADASGRHRRGRPKESGKCSSLHGSIMSIETISLSMDDDELGHTTLSLPDQDPPSPRNLARRNMVDAVEAELQSILDSGQTEEEEKEDDEAKKKAMVRNSSASSAGQTPSLLYGSRGSKSTRALPVKNEYTLPVWTSSGGTSAIMEVVHDTLDPIPPQGLGPGETKEKEETSNVHLAPPGDLMLAAKVARLSEKVDKLEQQEAIVDALIKKAEAKEKVEELRILRKSKSMFRRELQQIQYQKHQYELQASENVLTPEWTKVSIMSSTIGSDQHGEFALYIIEILQLGMDDNFVSGWVVARRYSEFLALHQQLKERHEAVRLLEFPSKWPLLKLQSSFVEARRISLERYMRRLLEVKEICQSEALRSFLSQQNVYVPGPAYQEPAGTEATDSKLWMSLPGYKTRGAESSKDAAGPPSLLGLSLKASSSTPSIASHPSPSVQTLQKSIATVDLSAPLALDSKIQRKSSQGFMKHIYRTVAAGIDDMLIGPSMLDMITQRLGEQVMEFSHEADLDLPIPDEPAPDSTLDPTLPFSTSSPTAPGEPEGITRFTEPLCDLFIEMFELKEKNNWLRRQAVVIILQQILGGTIEYKLRETIRYLTAESMVVFYFRKIMDSMWPNGGSLTFKEPRRPDEKAHSREEANRKLSTWLPDMLGSMVGRQNARRGARRLFTVLQNRRLNQDLAYVLLDELVTALFPGLNLTGIHAP